MASSPASNVARAAGLTGAAAEEESAEPASPESGAEPEPLPPDDHDAEPETAAWPGWFGTPRLGSGSAFMYCLYVPRVGGVPGPEGGGAHSTFCTCSLMRSMAPLISTMAREMSALGLLLAMVLASRSISCERK